MIIWLDSSHVSRRELEMVVKKKSTATRPKKSTAKSSKNEVRVDFSDTESRGGKKNTGRRKHYPEGDYHGKCTSAEITRSRGEKKTPEILVTYKIMAGKHKGGTIIDDLYLTDSALWRVRQTLEAMGIKVPSSRVKLDVRKMKDKEVALTLEDDEYEDKIRSRVTDTYLLSELEEDEGDESDDEEEEEEADEDEEEDEDEDEDDGDDEEEDEDEEEEDDDLEEMDLDDL
jgi:hypothetical protein